MQEFVDLILVSDRAGTELSLYIVMPVMTIMMALMKVLDEKRPEISDAHIGAALTAILVMAQANASFPFSSKVAKKGWKSPSNPFLPLFWQSFLSTFFERLASFITWSRLDWLF